MFEFRCFLFIVIIEFSESTKKLIQWTIEAIFPPKSPDIMNSHKMILRYENKSIELSINYKKKCIAP